MSTIARIEEYEDADRRERYCRFKLGLVPQDAPRGCRLVSDELRRKLEGELTEEVAAKETIRAEMESWLKGHPVWENLLLHVRGIGKTFAWQLLGAIESVATTENVSQMWRRAGYGLKDGRPQGGRRRGRPKSGGYYPINHACGKVARWLVMQEKGFYRHYYLQQRKRYEAGGAREGKAKPHAGAKLDMMRLFLSHVWACWRESTGLSAPEPYASAFLNHASIPWTDAVAFELQVGRRAESGATANPKQRAESRATANNRQRAE